MQQQAKTGSPKPKRSLNTGHASKSFLDSSSIIWTLFLAVYFALAALMVYQIIEECKLERTPSPRALAAWNAVRVADPAKFHYFIVFMLSVVLAFYALAIKLGDYSAVAAGLIFFAFDFFNEMSNALVFHFSNYSALWVATPQNTMFQIMIGWNIEIACTFAISGLLISWVWAPNPGKALGFFPSRLLWCIVVTIFPTCVELFLVNRFDALTWDFWWWNSISWTPLAIYLFGYLHFFMGCVLMYDMESVKLKLALPVLLLVVETCVFCYLGPLGLHWI